MSDKKHLKAINFRIDECNLSKPFNQGNPKHNPFVDYRHKADSLLVYVTEALKFQKESPIPYFQELMIQLSVSPSSSLHLFKKKFLNVDVLYDPTDALNSALSEEEIAEKFIVYLHAAIGKISQVYIFDEEPIRAGIDAYRQNNYQVSYRTAHGKLRGLGVDYEVCGSIGPCSSSAKLTINPGRPDARSTEFWSMDEPNTLGATGFSKVSTQEDYLLIAHQSRIFEDVLIPLDRLALDR